MSGTVLWIGGWASNLACWHAELSALYPGRGHAFLDAHALLADPQALPRQVRKHGKDCVVAAWSLGSLLLHRALIQGGLPDNRTVSLCPIFSFTAPGMPWSRATLAAMAARLKRKRADTLADFMRTVKGNSYVTQAAEAAWEAQAREYGIRDLEAGLHALATLDLAPATLAGRAGRSAFVGSPLDPLSPCPEKPYPEATWSAFAKGHLPFLDYPEIVGAYLGSQEGEP